MNNRGSLAGLRDACLQEQAARVAKLTAAQKRKAWDAARGVVSKTLGKIQKGVRHGKTKNFTGNH